MVVDNDIVEQIMEFSYVGLLTTTSARKGSECRHLKKIAKVRVDKSNADVSEQRRNLHNRRRDTSDINENFQENSIKIIMEDKIWNEKIRKLFDKPT